MSNEESDNGAFDFGGPLPPEVADGGYTFAMREVKKSDREVKGGGCMFFLKLQVEAAHDDNEDCQNSVSKHVTSLFMPKSRGHKYFNMFAREVQDLCKAFDVTPPKMTAEEMAGPEKWEEFLSSLVGRTCPGWVKNEVDKTGVERARVSFRAPKTVNLSKPVDDDEDETPAQTPKAKKGKK